MPRIPRRNMNTTYFHVMTQGIEKSYIFEKAKDIKVYISSMYSLSEEYNIKIIAYCIMNNHAHILLETPKVDDMSKYMQRLNTKYGKYYNKKYNRVGFVFRNRFKSEGIYDENHLYNCIRYIYNNPVKAGICEDISQYKYTNYNENKGITNKGSNNYYSFLEVEEDRKVECKKEIEEYLKLNNISLNDINNNKPKLKELIYLLKDKYNQSFRTISNELKIGRESIRKLYMKN